LFEALFDALELRVRLVHRDLESSQLAIDLLGRNVLLGRFDPPAIHQIHAADGDPGRSRDPEQSGHRSDVCQTGFLTPPRTSPAPIRPAPPAPPPRQVRAS